MFPLSLDPSVAPSAGGATLSGSRAKHQCYLSAGKPNSSHDSLSRGKAVNREPETVTGKRKAAFVCFDCFRFTVYPPACHGLRFTVYELAAIASIISHQR